MVRISKMGSGIQKPNHLKSWLKWFFFPMVATKAMAIATAQPFEKPDYFKSDLQKVTTYFKWLNFRSPLYSYQKLQCWAFNRHRQNLNYGHVQYSGHHCIPIKCFYFCFRKEQKNVVNSFKVESVGNDDAYNVDNVLQSLGEFKEVISWVVILMLRVRL